jgi:hypothetical protein
MNGTVNEIRTSAGLFLVPTGQAVVPTAIEQFEAVWDTGATNTAVASTVIAKLGSKPITFIPVGTGGGSVNAPVHLLNIALPNNVIVSNVAVTELKDLNSCDVLIGMDIIAQGDFVITHVSSKACFSFRMPSHKQIDFVPESNVHNMKLQRTSKKAAQPGQKARKKRK